MKLFKINDELTIVCEWKKTRTAFKHEATLLKNGYEIDKVKICYLNRTWESYEFESVIHKLLDQNTFLTTKEVEKAKAICAGKSQEENDKMFGSIAMVAKMGDVLCANRKEKNDWKARMLKAGLENKGLIMPENWETLSEGEKEKRLNSIINELK